MEKLALGDRPVARQRKFHTRALHGSLIIEVLVAYSCPAATLGQSGFYVRQCFDRGSVVRNESRDITGIAYAYGAGPDKHQISAEGADPIDDFLPAAFADGQHRHHRGDANDN